MDYNKVASQILGNVGGDANVREVVHCFTRLRFTLNDMKKANKAVIESIEGVISVVISGGQFQVVIGGKVDAVYDALVPLLSQKSTIASEPDSGSVVNKVLAKISAIFTPMVPAIAASGMLKGVLAVAKFYFAGKDIDVTLDQTYIFLNAASDVIFYFMPIVLAYASAKVFKTNEYIAMVLGGTMCYPAIVGLMMGDVAVSLFGVGITKALYTSSVIPILIGVFILSYVEKYLKKFVPSVLQIILVPALSLLIMLPATYLVFGPIGIYIGNIIIAVYQYLLGVSPILTGGFLGGLWGVLVIFGAHRALIPIGINDVALYGKQNLLAFAGAANFAQGGAAFGVFMKTKDKDVKAIALSATISAAVAGVTEPAIYGTNLKYKTPMINAIVFGAIGGAIMGAGGSYGNAFANNGVLTIPVYLEAGKTAFAAYMIGISVAFFGSALGTYFIGFKEGGSGTVSSTPSELVLNESNSDIVVTSPLKGNVIAQSDIKDEVFASKAMGQGFGIQPQDGIISAPDDGELVVLYPSLHAMIMRLKSGVEVLVHAGINTGQLNGEHFEKHMEQGATFAKGDKIVSFDVNAIRKKGYDVTTTVVVCNVNDYELIESKVNIEADLNTNVIYIKK